MDLRWRYLEKAANFGFRGDAKNGSGSGSGLRLREDEVRVLRQEAVGMYEAAVLEAGSAAALKRWMDDHGYKYPAGMDAVCEEYVKLGCRGLYIYDPAANSWTEKPLAMPKEIGQCPSGFYNPDLNAHFVHVAGDSDDNGTMCVYRYKKNGPR